MYEESWVSGTSGFAHLCVAVVKECEQVIIEAIDVQKCHRFLMVAQLEPRQHLNTFLQVQYTKVCAGSSARRAMPVTLE